jgi:hypothetical protein
MLRVVIFRARDVMMAMGLMVTVLGNASGDKTNLSWVRRQDRKI